MNLDLTYGETTALLRELGGLIDGDRYFLSSRIKTLRAIRAKIRPEPVREPFTTPQGYEPPRATARQRRRYGRGTEHTKIEGAPTQPSRMAAVLAAGQPSRMRLTTRQFSMRPEQN